jgi:hypothetical protein
VNETTAPLSSELNRVVMAGLIDIEESARHLLEHLRFLTVDVGERSLFSPDKLERAAAYIAFSLRKFGLAVEFEDYPCKGFRARNVVALSEPSGPVSARYLVGAHYDTILNTVGADDNASGIAVQLELARQLRILRKDRHIPVSVKFVSFALEEYPAYGTDIMGSRVHAKRMKARGEKTDGMICLEMVGYYCQKAGCQKYPLPFMQKRFSDRGDFIGIVANRRSKAFAMKVYESFGKNSDLPVHLLTIPFNGWMLPDSRRSDHAFFWDQGYPAVLVTDSSFFRNPNYHLPSDTLETLDMEVMARLVESLLLFFLSKTAKIGPQ